MKKLVYLCAFLCLVSCTNSKVKDQEKELQELRELAELDRQEMENQYAEYAMQYDELKKGIQDDSLLQRLSEEQQRAERLAEELKNLKTSDAAEIRRLKKELAAVRAILRTYVLQVDSLQRLNHTLTNERDEARAQVAEANSQISDLNTERASLTEKVAIASQLDATNIIISPVKKNSKPAKKVRDIATFAVAFTISKNVTAQTGDRMIYVQLLKPGQLVVNPSGTFSYENRSLECSAKKQLEYNGQATTMQMYIPINEALQPGKYILSIFADGQMIGNTSVMLDK